MQLVPGEAVREELGALVVLMRHPGLEGMQDFPPHGAHARPKSALLFELVTLRKKHHTQAVRTQAVFQKPFPGFCKNDVAVYV